MQTMTGAFASSADGRTVTVSGPPGGGIAAGDVVLVRPPGSDDPVAAQVLDAAGNGVLLAEPGPNAAARRFASAEVGAVAAADLEALQEGRGADLPIGTWTCGEVTVAARLRSQGFSRHTFLCGQSGSGKTYALGVILEQVLLGTGLRMVVLDPNADFVGLGDVRDDAPAGDAARLQGLDTRVLGADATGATPLRLRFTSMPRAAQAAVLRLDPIQDRDEYNAYLNLEVQPGDTSIGDVVRRLREGDDASRALAKRIENLGLPSWEVWAAELPSASEVVASGARVTVADLSGFMDPNEPVAVALDLIEQLWLQRGSRTPTLIVVDEAHNLCPAVPQGAIQTLLVERLIQIAAEGRKYGLWLFLSSQRPSKIHPQVLSQCDNLVLMRMNSPADVAELTEMFGFAPPALLASSPSFTQGEALVAGAFAARPSIVRMGQRLTREGGRDVAVPGL
jgi:hypothetical protein